MLGFLLGYSVAKSRSRARARRENLPEGYAEWEFMVLVGAFLIGVLWPVHLGFILTKWGFHWGWSVAIAITAGVIGLALGAGYIVIAIIYAGIWLAVLIEKGTAAEDEW
jgi:hypothetical protein